MHRTALASLVALVLAACGPAVSMSGPSTSTRAASGPVVGLTSRAEIEAALPTWREAAAAAAPDPAASAALADVPPGAEVDVFLGTWCGDSRREVTRLFRALESVPGTAPFALRVIGVDRAKQAPGLSEEAALRFVPTLIVRREGREVGRIVESAPDGIETALLQLLTGARTGVVTGRTDL